MKKKMGHIWLYYKWYIIAGLVVVLLGVNHVWEVRSRAEPDWEVAVVTGEYVSEGTRAALADQLGALWGDADGNGKTQVNVNFYQYDAQTAESMDTASFMASAVQLAADFKIGISVCFVTDCPELLLDNEALVSYGMLADTRLEGMAELEGFAVLGYGDSEQVEMLLKK